jgi:drug/metabolite transporter (DMT)-like permease
MTLRRCEEPGDTATKVPGRFNSPALSFSAARAAGREGKPGFLAFLKNHSKVWLPFPALRFSQSCADRVSFPVLTSQGFSGCMRDTPTQAAARAVRKERLLGILLMCGAVACFSGLDASAKWLSRSLPVLEVVWARYAASVLVVVLFVNPWTRPGAMRTKKPWLQAVRSLLLLLSTVLNFIALLYLQLAETISITFATPLIVAALAGPMLGEWVGPRRMAAILIGFSGVLVVTRPGIGGMHPAALLSVAGSFCYALYAIWTRRLAAYDSTETTLFYSGLAGVVVLTPLLPLFWQTPPSAFHWLLLASLGVYAAFGHFLLIMAYRLAPASVLSPFMYTQLIWMVLLGLWVFGDVPDGWTLVGAGIVVASGLYLLYRERVRGIGPGQ